MSNYANGSLSWWMDERRGELGLTWDDVANQANVSTETLHRWGRQRDIGRMRTTTKRGVERALQWQRGSIDAILSGESPTPLPESTETRSELDEKLAWMDREIAKMERQRDELLRQRDTR